MNAVHKPSLVALSLFGAAMGWLEAVVVVYIRAILELPPGQPPPAADEVMAVLGRVPWLLPTEQGREVATIVMIAAVAWLAVRGGWRRFGAFMLIFGVWDIAYYVGLYAHLRWPPSLATIDLLFLIPPHPWWNQPVWVPVAISVGLIVCGVWLLEREPARRRA